MSKGKHTPGPWKVGTVGNTKRQRFISSGLRLPATAFGDTIEERDANAHLIAAAPDLLDACKAIIKLIDDGELVRSTAHDHEDGWAMRQIPLVKALQQGQAAIRKAEGK